MTADPTPDLCCEHGAQLIERAERILDLLEARHDRTAEDTTMADPEPQYLHIDPELRKKYASAAAWGEFKRVIEEEDPDDILGAALAIPGLWAEEGESE